MHGGTYDLGRSYGETWEWTRQSGWRQFTGAGPGLRDHTQLAYDSERGRAVLFGGSGNDPNTAFGDTWEFDGAKWERVATSGPPARVHHAMQYDPSLKRVVGLAYDVKRDVLVLFGGGDPNGSALYADTWEFDGTTWRRVREK